MHLNYANFNQDNSCICVGYDTGFRIYECENFTKCYEEMEGGISIVEMLCNSSLVAVVGSGETSTALSRRRLRMINTKQHTTICELTFPAAILAVKMNLERLVVLIEGMLYIYDITKMRLLHTIEVSNANSKGLVALSMASNVVYACEGDVVVFDCKKLEAVAVISAHRREVTALAINNDGTMIATASDRGTLIRVFDAESGVKLKQLRRGTYPTKISALSLSDGWLIANSGTGTIHVFKMDGDESDDSIIDNESEHNVAEDDVASMSSDEDFQTSSSNSNSNSNNTISNTNANSNTNPSLTPAPTNSMGRILRRTSQTLGRRAAQSMGPLLPPRVLGVLEPSRHFASCKLPLGSSTPTGLVGLSYDRIVGVSESGEVLVYGLDKVKGGDCQLLETTSIL